ncbi:hypothetical protein Syun_025683 [Stephania yunnanensis]|uniref:Uncharacterized protein n=1 Tax=Stephania yunnanensis TaxID=152371 RepID=A0AAP0HRH5_9MAGN
MVWRCKYKSFTIGGISDVLICIQNITLCSIVTPPYARHHALLVPHSVCRSLYSIVALSAVAIIVGVESQPPSPSLIDSSASRTLLPYSATTVATMRTSVRAFSSYLLEKHSMELAFVEAWKRLIPNIEPPNTYLSFMKAHPYPRLPLLYSFQAHHQLRLSLPVRNHLLRGCHYASSNSQILQASREALLSRGAKVSGLESSKV